MPDNRLPEVQAKRNRGKVFGPLVLLLLALVVVPLLVLIAIFYFLFRGYLYLAVWLFWCFRGRHVLFVYSRSPNWELHIEHDVIPRLPPSSVVLNWSDRRAWSRRSLEANVFGHFLGDREHTPSAIIFRPFHRARVFRFHEAFLEAKHGKHEQLDRLEREFLVACKAL
jgi:hypothetical protein